MPRFDAANAECLIFTFKEGALSPLSHDLRIRATQFEIEVKGATSAAGFPSGVEVRSVFDARALRTECASDVPAGGSPGLSPADCRTVDGNIQRAVLHTDAYPEIRFHATRAEAAADGWDLRGELSLHGVTRALTVPVRPQGDVWVAEVEIDQRDWHIRPYTGMMGTFRIKPEVRIRVAVPRFQP